MSDWITSAAYALKSRGVLWSVGVNFQEKPKLTINMSVLVGWQWTVLGCFIILAEQRCGRSISFVDFGMLKAESEMREKEGGEKCFIY